MIPRFSKVKALDNYRLDVLFDDGKHVIYDMNDDIDTLPGYNIIKSQESVFSNFCIDESRTCISWSDEVDLPSDTIYEFGITQ